MSRRPTCYFRKTIELAGVKQATLAVAGDDQFELYVNGRRVGEGTATQGVRTFDVTSSIRDGDNTIAVKVDNEEGSTAGLAARLVVVNQPESNDGPTPRIPAGKHRSHLPCLWTRTSYFDARWKPASKLGPFSTFLANQQAVLQREARPQTDTSDAESPSTPTLACSAANAPSSRRPEAGQELEVPREFEVEQIAGHADTGSVTAITFAEDGQLIVAREDGQLWLLVDQDHDDQWDAVRDYGQVLKTCPRSARAEQAAVRHRSGRRKDWVCTDCTTADGDGRLDRGDA